MFLSASVLAFNLSSSYYISYCSFNFSYCFLSSFYSLISSVAFSLFFLLFTIINYDNISYLDFWFFS